MKRIILTSLFIIQTLLCTSQNLVQEGKLWSNSVVGTEQGSQLHTYFIKFQEDTLISSVRYKKVWKADDNSHENWFLYGYIREDIASQKVYLYNSYSNEDILLYDFSLETGDSIFTDDGELYIKVDTVIYEPFGTLTDTLKQICFDSKCNSKWIDGIGSMWGVLEGINRFYMVGEEVNLICYFENKYLIYHNPDFGECYVTSVNETLFSNNLIEVTQQKSNLVIIKNFTNKKGIFQVFDIIGNQIIQENIELEERQIYVPLAGTYIYRFISKTGAIQNGKFVVW